MGQGQKSLDGITHTLNSCTRVLELNQLNKRIDLDVSYFHTSMISFAGLNLLQAPPGLLFLIVQSIEKHMYPKPPRYIL